MDDIYQKIDRLLIERTSEIATLVNSNVTSRFYWSTCQAECFYQITKTIEALLEIAKKEDTCCTPPNNRCCTPEILAAIEKQADKSKAEEAMTVFLSRLDYAMQLTGKGWSMRQLEIARHGGPILFSPSYIDEHPPKEPEEVVDRKAQDGPTHIFSIIAFTDGIPELLSTRSNQEYSNSDWAEFISTEKNIDRFGAENLSAQIENAWEAGYWSIEDGYEIRLFEDIIDHTPNVISKWR